MAMVNMPIDKVIMWMSLRDLKAASGVRSEPLGHCAYRQLHRGGKNERMGGECQR